MNRALFGAMLAAFLPLMAHASGTRSISDTPSRPAHAYTTNVGSGANAEAVDLTDLADFYDNTRTFSCLFVFDEAILLQPIASGSVTASQLTTPDSDGTPSNVYYLPSALSPISIPIEGVGWIWQSVSEAAKADARAICNY